MTQKIGDFPKETFLSFSIVAERENAIIQNAAMQIRMGDGFPCDERQVYWERYAELRQRFKKLERESLGDYDFGASGTLKEVKASLKEIYTMCKKY